MYYFTQYEQHIGCVCMCLSMRVHVFVYLRLCVCVFFRRRYVCQAALSNTPWQLNATGNYVDWQVSRWQSQCQVQSGSLLQIHRILYSEPAVSPQWQVPRMVKYRYKFFCIYIKKIKKNTMTTFLLRTQVAVQLKYLFMLVSCHVITTAPLSLFFLHLSLILSFISGTPSFSHSFSLYLPPLFPFLSLPSNLNVFQIGRASCRERV